MKHSPGKPGFFVPEIRAGIDINGNPDAWLPIGNSRRNWQRGLKGTSPAISL